MQNRNAILPPLLALASLGIAAQNRNDPICVMLTAEPKAFLGNTTPKDHLYVAMVSKAGKNIGNMAHNLANVKVALTAHYS